jgi:hypothetical protein
MSSSEHEVVSASPLENAGILLHVLSILGPGHHLFISAVSKAWRESYKRVGSVQMPELIYYGNGVVTLCTLRPKTTLYSAVFASASRVKLGHDCGVTFDKKNTQQLAGRCAEVSTLQATHDLGLAFTDDVLIGAAASGSVPKLHWLHTEQGWQLPPFLSYYAARSGSIDMLRWLKEHGIASTDTCVGAAYGAHLDVLQYLADEECEWDDYACVAAAKNGHLSTLQWLHEHGCPWEADRMCSDAAECGSIEMLVYLKQQGCE